MFLQVPSAVQDEIRQINDCLIDTEVEVSYEGSEDAAAQGREGVVVTCSYKCVAVCPSLTQNKMVSWTSLTDLMHRFPCPTSLHVVLCCYQEGSGLNGRACIKGISASRRIVKHFVNLLSWINSWFHVQMALPRVWFLIPPSYPQSSPVFWADYMVPNARCVIKSFYEELCDSVHEMETLLFFTTQTILCLHQSGIRTFV